MSDEPRQHERELIDEAWREARGRPDAEPEDATIPLESAHGETETAGPPPGSFAGCEIVHKIDRAGQRVAFPHVRSEVTER